MVYLKYVNSLQDIDEPNFDFILSINYHFIINYFYYHSINLNSMMESIILLIKLFDFKLIIMIITNFIIFKFIITTIKNIIIATIIIITMVNFKPIQYLFN